MAQAEGLGEIERKVELAKVLHIDVRAAFLAVFGKVHNTRAESQLDLHERLVALPFLKPLLLEHAVR